MRYLPIVMGVSFIVVVKIIKNQRAWSEKGSWHPKAKLACPHAEGPAPFSQRTLHEGAPLGVLAIAGAKSTEGKIHQAVRKAGASAMEGWTGNPSAGGVSANPTGCNAANRQKRLPNIPRTRKSRNLPDSNPTQPNRTPALARQRANAAPFFTETSLPAFCARAVS